MLPAGERIGHKTPVREVLGSDPTTQPPGWYLQLQGFRVMVASMRVIEAMNELWVTRATTIWGKHQTELLKAPLVTIKGVS